MKLFTCGACGAPQHFEATACDTCGKRLGFAPRRRALVALELDETLWRPAERQRASADEAYVFCANAAYGACNWLVPAEEAGAERFCLACRHNRTIPDLALGDHIARWRKLEEAKKRLVYTLVALDLPLTRRPEDPNGLAFDFLADPPDAAPVTTGHTQGLVTIALAEADDVEREARRHAMREPYRTLLGHLRHEVGHYYFEKLVVERDAIEAFRTLFGDERTDYAAALARHYEVGPPADWAERHVSAYASAHPWEDWAETFAHYLHMVDTLETAAAFGLSLSPREPGAEDLAAHVAFDPHDDGAFGRLVAAWGPLTFAVNALNRSMGQGDLYPFAMPPPAVEKLAFVHARVRR